MLEYNLCKSLKEAGFNKFGFDVDTSGTIMPNVANEPTLSELIDACGDELQSIDRCNESKHKWEAIRVDDEYGDPIGFTKGDTPEEAVAKLWLELNKK